MKFSIKVSNYNGADIDENGKWDYLSQSVSVSRYMDVYYHNVRFTYKSLYETIEEMRNDESRKHEYKLLSLAKSLIIFSFYGGFGVSEPKESLNIVILSKKFLWILHTYVFRNCCKNIGIWISFRIFL